MSVLIVEDDIRLSSALARILEDHGYETDVVHDGQSGLDWASAGEYDVIILDVMLPVMDGFAVSKALRRAGVSTPVLLLTARDAINDKITGYDSGADDYMTKPFSPAELMAHLRALTRRTGDVIFETISAGDLELDLDSYELRHKQKGSSPDDSKSVRLSSKEFEIARILMSNPGQAITKDQIINRAWGIDSNAGDNNVEAYISFLRKKLAHIGSSTKIETLRKGGYRLVIDQA
ncbi:MAG: response regulator transcription factor [Eggerthellaceae bacterium]|nr:response regulator transcription factor [Eggerthellaceae bacterium]